MNILKPFMPRIVVDIAPQEFLFRRGSRQARIATYMYLSNSDALVVSVGEAVKESGHITRVDLFGPLKQSAFDKYECLEAYFRYGIRKMLGRQYSLRPILYIRNADSLDQILCGYHMKLLWLAATNGGAYECWFIGDRIGSPKNDVEKDYIKIANAMPRPDCEEKSPGGRLQASARP